MSESQSNSGSPQALPPTSTSTTSPAPTYTSLPPYTAPPPSYYNTNYRRAMPSTPPRAPGSSRGMTSPMRYNDFMRAFMPPTPTRGGALEDSEDVFGGDEMPALESEDEGEQGGERERAVVERRYTEEEIFGDDGSSSDEENQAPGAVIRVFDLNTNLSYIRAEDIPVHNRTVREPAGIISSGSSATGESSSDEDDKDDENEADVEDNNEGIYEEAVNALAEARVRSRSASPRQTMADE